MRASVAAKLATAAQIRAAGGVGLLLAVALLGTAVTASAPAPDAPLAAAGALGAVAALELATAYLMFGQYRLTKATAMTALGGGYAFLGACSALRILFIDRAVAQPLAITPDDWLHLLGAGGFAVATLIYCALHLRDRRRGADDAHRRAPAQAATLAFGLAIAAAITLDLSVPDLPSDQPWRDLWRSGATPIVMAAQALAFIALIALGRGRDLIQLWLAVALLAAVGDLAAASLGGGRGSVGQHQSVGFAVVAAGSVLLMLLREMIWLSLHIVELNARLMRQASVDGLTGVANRRSFDDHLASEWRRAQRDGTSLAALMIDIDFFKAYNDGYGHVAGDGCIRKVAAVVAGFAKRAGDVAARYGGEEFALILPRADAAAAADIAQAVRAAVFAQALPHAYSAAAPVVTVSVGWTAMVPGATQDQRALIAAADAALYEAKRQGRNRVAGQIG